MTLAQLQEATAFLVRFPEKGRGLEWDAFVGGYDLTYREAAQLHHVAHNAQVTKYGKKLRKFRYVDVVEALPAPETILGEELFEQLWFDHFEPIAAGIATENLADEFLKFLTVNPEARGIIHRKGPAHAEEFLSFLAAETSFENEPEVWRQRSVPPGSVLTHAALHPMAFHYDVPKLIQKDSDKTLRSPKRAPKPFYYVLVLKDGQERPALFAIDRAVYEFLKAQLEDPSRSPERPAVYADLVKAGLCVG